MRKSLRVALCYRCEERDAGDIYYRIVPTGLLNLHGVLRAAGFDSRLFNFSACSWLEVRARLAEFQPRLVGVSHFTFNHAASVGLYALAREACPAALIVGGGVQATFLDETLLRRIGELDLVVRGEGEEPVLAITRRLAAAESRWEDVPGVTVRAGAKVVRVPAAPPRDDLDAWYPPERFEGVWGVRPEEQFPFLVTSRGCPAACVFCCSPGYWRRRVRYRSVPNVLEEIRFLRQRYGLICFGVRDDTFTARKERVREFCRVLEAERPLVRWNCQSRVNLVDEERLRWMKQAGCEQIQFGIESVSPRLLRFLGKTVRAEQVRPALAACRRVGIRSGAYFITGIPGQTKADLDKVRRLFLEDGLGDGVVSPLCYYPGTALFERANRNGRVSEDIFFGDDPARLLVRRDPQARRDWESLTAFINRHSGSP